MLQKLYEEIDSVIEVLEQAHPATETYEQVLSILERLYSLVKSAETKKEEPARINKLMEALKNQALVSTLGNLAIALMILHYEKFDVVTTKAWSLIRK